MARRRSFIPRRVYLWAPLIIVLIATLLRIWNLGSVPPGLSSSEALIALDVREFTGLTLPIWVLRLVPALLGVVLVAATYSWVLNWFGRRPALIASFLVAVSPWSLTLSRNIDGAIIAPTLLVLTLWLATRVWYERTLLRIIPLVIILAITALVAGFSSPDFRSLGMVSQWPERIWQTLGAFNFQGDENNFYNLGGLPLLNVFVGIMFIAGVLLSLGRNNQLKNRLLLALLTITTLFAAILSAAAPNAGILGVALPLVMTFAGLGIGYMLDTWYSTFPINSAARLSGQVVIVLLLVLTAYQGYAQYFVAWAGSSQTHRVYNDGAMSAARWHKDAKNTGNHVIVAEAQEIPALRYLLADKDQVIVLPSQLKGELTARPLHLIITTAARTKSIEMIQAAAPGGTLRSHTSPLDDAEIFYDYEVSK